MQEWIFNPEKAPIWRMKALICGFPNRFPNMLKKSEFLNEYGDEFVDL
jgi:hypothetical protein